MQPKLKTLRKHIPVSFSVTGTDNTQSLSWYVPFIPDEVIIRYVCFVDSSDSTPLISVDKLFYVNIPTLIPSDTPLAICPVNYKGHADLQEVNVTFPLNKPVTNYQQVVLLSAAGTKPDVTGNFIMHLEFIKYVEE